MSMEQYISLCGDRSGEGNPRNKKAEWNGDEWNDMTLYLFHKLNDRVGEQIRSSVAELLESHEARIWVSENTMAITERPNNEGKKKRGISESRSKEEGKNVPSVQKTTHPGTTCPLFKVLQRNSLMFSWVTSPPISFCMFSCHRSTSWLAKL